jgi:hypothetical protein
LGNGQYADDFPDSTKNTGVISPPDLGNESPFVFETEVASGFPDLSQREFLKPSYHVGLKSSSSKTEDLYERIERRLAEYRTEMKNQQLNNGLKEDKLQGGEESLDRYSSFSSHSSTQKLKKEAQKSGLIR